MPADKRLWMPFPNDFWMHPKIRVLSDSAFRTFVELIGYSRMQDLDGVIPCVYARREWKAKALTELQHNHPERPSLMVEGDNLIIWNYDEHQETREKREKRQNTNRANGSLGGRPPKGNRPETESVISGNRDGTESKPESESEVEIETTDSGNPSPNVTEVDAGEVDEGIRSDAAAVGIKNLPRVTAALGRVVGAISTAEAIDLTRAIVLLAKKPVQNVEAYIEKTCINSPGEVADRWAAVRAVNP